MKATQRTKSSKRTRLVYIMKRLSKDARSYITTAVAAILLLGGASGVNLAYSNAYNPATQAATDGTTDTQQATDATSDTQTADQAADAQQAAGDAAPAADATQQASTDNGSSADTAQTSSSSNGTDNSGSGASASTPAQQASPGGHYENQAYTYYTTEQQPIWGELWNDDNTPLTGNPTQSELKAHKYSGWHSGITGYKTVQVPNTGYKQVWVPDN